MRDKLFASVGTKSVFVETQRNEKFHLLYILFAEVIMSHFFWNLSQSVHLECLGSLQNAPVCSNVPPTFIDEWALIQARCSNPEPSLASKASGLSLATAWQNILFPAWHDIMGKPEPLLYFSSLFSTSGCAYGELIYAKLCWLASSTVKQ